MHTILGDTEPYALCNVAKFDNFSMIPHQFKIEPSEDPTRGENPKKQVQIIEMGMGTYMIDEAKLFTSVKDLG